MPFVSKILQPVEFNARAIGAAHYVEALAAHFHCEVLMLHVVAAPHGAYAPPEALSYLTAQELVDALAVQKQAELEQFLADELNGPSVRRMVLRGDPARQIVAVAEEEQCGLIVMATHSHGPFRRFLLGSVTAKVLHDAKCPVWTGPHMETAPPREAIRFRRVLCAIDLAPHSRDVLAWGARFAREFAAELGIVHAIPTSSAVFGGISFDPGWRNEIQARAKAQIANLQEAAGSEAAVFVETGETAHVVSTVARQFEADLIVMGRGAPGLIGRLRTNSYAILRESPCAVVGV